MRRVIINKSAAARRGNTHCNYGRRKAAQKTLLKSNKPKVLSCLPCFVKAEYYDLKYLNEIKLWKERKQTVNWNPPLPAPLPQV